MYNVMIDIETLGTVPGSAIVSLGAFCLETEKEFYRVIDLGSNFKYRMTVDSETLCWWISQGEEAKSIFKSKDKVPLDVALKEFSEWLPDRKQLAVWGNGSVFDITLCEVAFRRVAIEVPWNFTKIYDLRTIAMLFPEVKKPKNQLAHNSLEDAVCQGRWLKQLLAVGR